MRDFLCLGLLTNYVLIVYLNLREYFMLCQPPSAMALKLSTPDIIAKTKSYNKTKMIVEFFATTIDLLKDMAILNRRLLQSLYFGYFDGKVRYPELLFFLAYINASRILNLPFSLVSTFYVEEKYGFNKTTVATFAADFLKLTVLTSLLLAPIWVVTSKIITMFASYVYVYLWIFIAMFQLVVVIIFPTVIQPLFNKFEELKDEELLADVKELADRVGITAKKVLVVDASRRSRHANAYFIGLTKEKRVVLFDTLLKQVNREEALAVLCHEFGHWKCSHSIKTMLLLLVIQFFYLFAFNFMLHSELVQKTLFYEKEPLVIKLLYFGYFAGITNIPVTFLFNVFSRMNEREADRYAVSMGYGKELISALIKLCNESNANLDNDPVYSMVNRSHPTLLERIALIEDELSKRK
jgi:STE24 endopeptidase